jgi:hypothetical protein
VDRELRPWRPTWEEERLAAITCSVVASCSGEGAVVVEWREASWSGEGAAVAELCGGANGAAALLLLLWQLLLRARTREEEGGGVEGAAGASAQPYGHGQDGHRPRPLVAVHHAASARWGEAGERSRARVEWAVGPLGR